MWPCGFLDLIHLPQKKKTVFIALVNLKRFSLTEYEFFVLINGFYSLTFQYERFNIRLVF